MPSILLYLSLFFSFTPARADLDRPPQFVLLSFDNCQENQTWKQVSCFLENMNAADKNRLRFTFFLSAVGLLSDKQRSEYENPSVVDDDSSSTARNVSRAHFKERASRYSRGRNFSTKGESNIDFGGSDLDVNDRIAFINKLYVTGNEIASHAVGHFNGERWTADMWRHEFREYNRILQSLATPPGLSEDQSSHLVFGPEALTSFRAPYLGKNKNLIQVLKDFAKILLMWTKPMMAQFGPRNITFPAQATAPGILA